MASRSFENKSETQWAGASANQDDSTNYQWSEMFQCPIVQGVLAPDPISYLPPNEESNDQEMRSGEALNKNPRNLRKSEGDESLLLRLLKSTNGGEKYILELIEVTTHRLSQSYISVFEQGGAWHMNIKAVDHGNPMMQQWLEDPNPPLFQRNSDLSLHNRLTGWTLERRMRANGKEDLFYYHRNKQYRSFREMATFIIYANKKLKNLRLANDGVVVH